MARRDSDLVWLAVAGAGVAGLALVGLVGVAVATSAAGSGAVLSGEAAAIVAAYRIDPRLAMSIADTAHAVGTHPFWLADLIRHESAGTFDPAVKNPSSTASGLIQITELTAKRMHPELTPEKLRAMSALEQMAWVRYYLEWTAGGHHPDDPRPVPLDSPQRLFMTVFFPPARDVDPSMAFADIPHPLADRVTPNNPGKVTPEDYIDEVLAAGKLSGLVPARSIA